MTKSLSPSSISWDAVVRKIYRQVAGSDPRKALLTATHALDRAKKEKAKKAIPRLILGRAHAYRESGMYEEALSDYTEAARIFRKEGMMTEAWRTVIGKMDALDQIGKYRKALSEGAKAARYFRFAKLPLWEAKIYANTGNIYQHLGQFEEARKFYRKAFPVLSAEQPLDGHILLFNEATASLSCGKPDEAIELLNASLIFFDQQNLKSFVARTHYNLAYGKYLLGKYQDALLHLEDARFMLTKLRDHSFLASCYLDEAELYLRLNRPVEAISRARRAIRKFKALNMPYELSESEALTGIVLLRAGKISEALPYLNKARAYFSRKHNRTKSAELDSNLALAFLRKGELHKARFYLKRAYSVFSRTRIYSRMLSILTHSANIDLQEGRVNPAIQTLNKANRFLNKVALPWVLFPYYQTFGKAALQAGLPEAHSYLEKAIDFAESMRTEIPAEDLRMSYLEDKLAPYNLLVESNLQSEKNWNKAFLASERARSRILLDLLEGSLGFDSDQGRLTQLDKELALLQKDQWHGISPGVLRHSKEQEKKIIRLLRKTQHAGVSKEEFNLSVEEIRASLLPDQCILSYYKIDDRIHSFFIDTGGLTAHPEIASAQDLLQSWTFLRFHLERGRTDPSGSLLSCESHLRTLYEKLFRPVSEELKRHKLITIIPHGWLHAFPFHCLKDEEGYLAERFQFSYAPSASVYLHCLRTQSMPAARDLPLVLGYADSLAPWIDAEVDELRKLYPAAVVYKSGSAVSGVLKNEGSSVRFIHIASHGRFLPEQPLFSGVLLADGWFTLPRIYHLKLNAELVTLSGCETGTHQISAGDELVGLMRGFLYAGASSMLLSLWRVFDISTALFMKQFYQQINSGKSLAESWQHALLATKERWPHPYYWGPFLLIGKPDTTKTLSHHV